ncbi:NADH:ubiquinone oxidoreductase [Pseudomonas sp. S25]|uniref:NADH:ubiquinone oxidoreductase n=2 Tax=Pseudomonas maioricensis TaxID=1766623 RepID=A0ABS9ZEF2_9PSED|nr:NADH:ubiquinone oxidoreductase [Pseudomonas sp. S25]MCI8208850.1 NADH:ubiquinone oxidoreductase [Pseudomonas sp. S25]
MTKAFKARIEMFLGMILVASAGNAWAEACLVHSQAERLDVKVCQANRNIPPKLFHDGFCQPQLAGQKTDVTFLEQCPTGAFGICSNAQVANMPYREDIHYYGVASDAAYLKPFCEGQSQGKWLVP